MENKQGRIVSKAASRHGNNMYANIAKYKKSADQMRDMRAKAALASRSPTKRAKPKPYRASSRKPRSPKTAAQRYRAMQQITEI